MGLSTTVTSGPASPAVVGWMIMVLMSGKEGRYEWQPYKFTTIKKERRVKEIVKQLNRTMNAKFTYTRAWQSAPKENNYEGKEIQGETGPEDTGRKAGRVEGDAISDPAKQETSVAVQHGKGQHETVAGQDGNGNESLDEEIRYDRDGPI